MTPQATDTQGKYVSQVEVFEGRVDITFGKSVHQDIFGDTMSVTPYMSAEGSIVWRCGAAPAPVGAVPLTGGGITSAHQAPTLDTRYLPSACRN